MGQIRNFLRIISIGAFLLSTVFLNAAVIESVSGESGDRSWENVNIWVGGIIPGAADTVIINGLVTVYTPVPETFTACARLTVNSGAILRDYWGGVLHVNGELINNGTIENSYDGTYHLFLKISGNVTNNGLWKNALTTLNGSEVQYLSGSGEFSGNEFISENTADTLIVATDLQFYTTTIDLNNDRLDLQGHKISLTGNGLSWGTCYLSEAELIGRGGEIYANSWGVLSNSRISDVTLTGIIQVANGCEFFDNVIVGDTLNNTWGSGATLDIKGNLINNGVIRDANDFYHLFINIEGNLTNNGEWTNHITNLSGTNPQHLTFSSPFSSRYFYDTDSSSAIIADSDIHFHNCYIDLDSAEFDLHGFQLSFTGDSYTNSDLRNATIIANGGSVYLNNYAYLYQSVLDGVTLRGEVQIKEVTFQGTTTVMDTLENEYRGSEPITVNGSIINNGVIRNFPNDTHLIFNVSGNITNNGIWTNSLTELKSNTKQHVIINNDHSIGGRLDLHAMIPGDTYQWLIDDAEITDASSQSLTFNSVGKPEFGHYVCRVSGSGAEVLSSRMIRISNGSPEFSPLPDTGFAEDHFLKLPVSYLFDYVEDPNDADLSLVWTITDNDNVITEIVADTINFSAGLNWFGSDTLTVIVSDGELSDTTTLIVIVEPVNDAPVITAIADTSMMEDDSLKLVLTATDVDGDSLIFMATCDTAAIEVVLSANYLTLIPIADWSGCAQIRVIVSDTELSDTADFKLTVNAINDPPAAFGLISPVDSTLNRTDTVMVFQWEAATDADGDSLIYTLLLEAEGFEYAFSTDTNCVNLNVIDIELPFEVNISWTVYVFDGTDTTWSDETWQFSVSRELRIDSGKSLPHSYALHQSYPNPFNPSTTIHYSIPKTSQVTLAIFNIQGQLVEKLVSQKQEPGYYAVHWDASRFSSGTYFYRIQADGFQQVKKCILVK